MAFHVISDLVNPSEDWRTHASPTILQLLALSISTWALSIHSWYHKTSSFAVYCSIRALSSPHVAWLPISKQCILQRILSETCCTAFFASHTSVNICARYCRYSTVPFSTRITWPLITFTKICCPFLTIPQTTKIDPFHHENRSLSPRKQIPFATKTDPFHHLA